MPYTKKELKKVNFYQKFVNELRSDYLLQVKKLKQDNFRRNGVLYSFEEIQSTNGLDDLDTTSGVYQDVIDKDDIDKMKTVNSNKLNVVTKKSILEKTVDRNIVELATSRFAETLPEDIVDGDNVTSDDFTDKNIYKIVNSQKRLYSDIGVFYADSNILSLKTITKTDLNSIPEGEIIE